MKRWSLLAATVASAALFLSACGGSGGFVLPPPAATTPPPAAAEAPKFKLAISKTEDVAGTFGSVGAYEKITGTFTGEVDPKDAHNAIIQDLSLAPRNAEGKVEYSAGFVLFKPKDMAKANGVLRYDAPNLSLIHI